MNAASSNIRPSQPAPKRRPTEASCQSSEGLAEAASYSPSQFGKLHRGLVEDSIGPLAKSIGARSLSDKLSEAVRTESCTNKDVALVADNLREIQDTRKGAIPLKEAYEIDQKLAEQAATQAAKSSGGSLTSESARFLPQSLRADFERLSGGSISEKPGIAVDGVSVKREGNKVAVAIEFEKALAGASAKNVVLALTDTLTVAASRLDGAVENPALPPYWIAISPRQGKVDSDTQLKNGNGWRSFTDPAQGHLIHAGGDCIELMKGSNAKKPFQTVTFQLDKVNDYGVAQKPPSSASKAVREAWEGLFSEESGGFDFEAGIKAGRLESKALAEVRDQPGIKVLFSDIRENTGQSVSKLVKEGLLEFAVDKQSNSLAVLRRTDGESDQRLSIVDLAKGKWVGNWAVGDDGTREWNER